MKPEPDEARRHGISAGIDRLIEHQGARHMAEVRAMSAEIVQRMGLIPASPDAATRGEPKAPEPHVTGDGSDPRALDMTATIPGDDARAWLMPAGPVPGVPARGRRRRPDQARASVGLDVGPECRPDPQDRAAICPFFRQSATAIAAHQCSSYAHPITISARFAASYCLNGRHANCQRFSAAQSTEAQIPAEGPFLPRLDNLRVSNSSRIVGRVVRMIRGS
jgi:hypothetical protein